MCPIHTAVAVRSGVFEIKTRNKGSDQKQREWQGEKAHLAASEAVLLLNDCAKAYTPVRIDDVEGKGARVNGGARRRRVTVPRQKVRAEPFRTIASCAERTVTKLGTR